MRLLLDFKQKQNRPSWTWKEGLFLLTGKIQMFGSLGDTEPSGSYHIFLLQYSESFLLSIDLLAFLYCGSNETVYVTNF